MLHLSRQAGFAIALLVLFALPGEAANRSYHTAALGAARWIEMNSLETPQGVVWASDPLDPKSVNTTLYAGTPGPILFFLEAYRYTGDRTFLEEGRRGADALLASISKNDDAGLYEGLAGSGFTLGEAYLITRDPRYRQGAFQCLRWLEEKAQKTPEGVKWNDVTDIIGGSSGTGLFLLWTADHLHASEAKELAARAGEHLIAIAQHESNGGLKWMMDPTYPREMPNFSHGTAGVAYYLATLYQATGHKKYLDAALAGATYLLSIADINNRYCMVYHNNQNKDLYYLGWCHGPAGTARLFYRLYQVTRDPKWMGLVKKCADAIVANGGPEKVVTPGVWHNVSACCGVTAEAEFFYDVYLVTHDRKWLDEAIQASNQLLNLSDSKAGGNRWVQVETRVRPDIAIAQTGYMQGASGIGMWLLHFSAALSGQHRPVVTFPDNPFVY
ncbi:MAG TPA: lanthionine synthetase LanC family protein [Candidatus Acidoferrales bacterium]|nr:lanthionine synthetase LanC family protein [Candidatus Acidoferrales bacterium]